MTFIWIGKALTQNAKVSYLDRYHLAYICSTVNFTCKYLCTVRAGHYSLEGSRGEGWSSVDCWWTSESRAILDRTPDPQRSLVSLEHPQPATQMYMSLLWTLISTPSIRLKSLCIQQQTGRSLTCKNSLWGRHLSRDRNLVTRGAALPLG